MNGEIPDGAAVVFHVNTNNQIVAYSNTTAVTLTGTTVSEGWNKFGVECDYVSKGWNLELNDELVVSNFAFHGIPSAFTAIEIMETSTSHARIDEINISVLSVGDDTDGDGLPDWWETSYFGDLSPNPGDLSSNGVDTVYSAYVAGLDPTSLTNRFMLSVIQSPPAVLGWNASSGRVYTIYWTSNLLSGFGSPLTNGLPWTPAIFTDSTHSAEDKGFYKIEVELE